MDVKQITWVHLNSNERLAHKLEFQILIYYSLENAVCLVPLGLVFKMLFLHRIIKKMSKMEYHFR